MSGTKPPTGIEPNAVYTRQEAAERMHMSAKELDKLPVRRAKKGRRTVLYRGAWLLAYLERIAA